MDQQAAETGEIPEEIQSFQESQTTDGKRQNRPGALAEEEPMQSNGFELEVDSEDEDNQDDEDYDNAQRNGYGVELLTETAED